MLTTLRIKNLALVSDLTLELGPGFNAITGETGAGKSIIIGALNLVLGERADRTLIRSGADGCTVEAVFDVTTLRAPLKGFLEENGLEPCEEHLLVLKRTFSAAGGNRQFINGSATTLAVLKDVGEWLVDMHGPHDHQSLLHVSRQLSILDAFGGLDETREAYADQVRCRSDLETEKASLIVDEQTYAQQLDLLRHQVREIEAAALDPEEEESLEQEYNRASNAARLLQLAQMATELLDGEENSMITQAGMLGRTLSELEHIDPSAASFTAMHEQALASWQELRTDLSRYADRMDIDPAQLQQLEERLTLLQSLKRKYGGSLMDVIAFGGEARAKLEALESRDADLECLNAALQSIDREINRLGRELTVQRRKLIPKLSKAVVKQLEALGFQQSRFDVALESADGVDAFPGGPPSSGFDTIEFQFAPNPGEPARALRAIASSGEMARVMLALKTVLAAQDEVPVLVFDEVDANVGGETASAVGEKMRQIGTQRQVLSITHLAPVAAAAGSHYVVTKEVKGDRTLTAIRELGEEERVGELARMLGGRGDAARQHAATMLG